MTEEHVLARAASQEELEEEPCALSQEEQDALKKEDRHVWISTLNTKKNRLQCAGLQIHSRGLGSLGCVHRASFQMA